MAIKISRVGGGVSNSGCVDLLVNKRDLEDSSSWLVGDRVEWCFWVNCTVTGSFRADVHPCFTE
jgi:hypothetical protein